MFKNMKKYFLPLCLCFFGFSGIQAQVLSNKTEYTRADSLRGSMRAARDYEVLKYHLKLKVDPEEKFISGSNTIGFQVKEGLSQTKRMQVDLFENMKVDSIVFQQKKLAYNREYNAVFIEFEEQLPKDAIDSIQFYYSGNPIVAKNAPWDGGVVFTKDEDGNPWIATAVQGIGASLWFPNKDTQSDEPEEVLMEIAVPNGLMDVSNGRLIGEKDLENGYTQWSWKVVNPINNYDISLNIGNYVHFSDKFQDLDLDYYVLPRDLEKAKKQFAEVKLMMDCFYEKLGPYPFPEDGYKLVQAPYLGMEHQSAVTYGNKFENGYLGRDLSGTGIGLRWDFIIIHESAHEWFGNSITAADIADMWLHEGFTSYAESIYIECRWGKKDALEYIMGLRKAIGNQSPMIGDYGVNSEGSGDMYNKGSNLLNTLRSVFNDDDLWWKTLKAYTQTYKHQIIQTETAEKFFESATDVHLKPIFAQYLRHAAIPVLQLKKDGNSFSYRWKVDVADFEMPVDVRIGNKEIRIFPTEDWQKYSDKVKKLKKVSVVASKFYVDTQYIK